MTLFIHHWDTLSRTSVARFPQHCGAAGNNTVLSNDIGGLTVRLSLLFRPPERLSAQVEALSPHADGLSGHVEALSAHIDGLTVNAEALSRNVAGLAGQVNLPVFYIKRLFSNYLCNN